MSKYRFLSIMVGCTLTHSLSAWAEEEQKGAFIYGTHNQQADDIYRTEDLDEVVVTGQGAEIQKRRLSSNVQTLSAKAIEQLSVPRLDQLLQTAMPNMKVNLTSSQPGGTSLMFARGLSSAYSNGTPVIYVDGVRVDNNNSAYTLSNDLNGGNHSGGYEGQTSATSSISDIPMENIERIEFVPGGAATTIYGSDAANGVIQIFTKHGSNGRFHTSFSADMGAESANTDFYFSSRTRDLIHQTGFTQRYRLNMEGGNDRTGWSLGASMGQSDGTIVGNAQEQRRYDVRLGMHHKINKALEYQSSWGASFQNLRYARNGNEGLYSGLWSIECGDFGYADNNSGLKTLYPLGYQDEKGNWQRYFFTTDVDELNNEQLALLKEICRKGESLSNHTDQIRRFQTSQSLTYKPFAGLVAKATLGLDYRHNLNKYTITNEWLQATGAGKYLAQSSMRNFERSYLGLTFDANAQYTYRPADWLSSITTAGFQFFSTDDHQSTQMGKNLRDGSLTINGAATKTADEWLSYLYNYGFFAQENIGIMDRYYLDLGLRADYNSAFGDNVGWQYYPKVGLSYLMTDEEWLHGLDWLPQLRLFANYGVAGLYPPAYAYQRTISFASYNGSLAAGFDQYGNDDLGPEKKHSFEVGLNSSLLRGIVRLGVNWYYTLTRNAIFDTPLPPSVGEGSCLSNVGRIENKGIEVNLGLQLYKNRDWDVELQSSLNTNRNKVLSTGGAVPFAIGGFGTSTIQSVVSEGESVGYLRGSRATMQDGKAVIDKLQNLGNTLPRCYGSLALNVTWRNLNVYMNGDYQTGGNVHSYNAQFRFRNGIRDSRIPEELLQALGMNADGSNRWAIQKANWTNVTNYFVYSSDFLKVRQLGANYTFKQPIKHISSVNVGLQITNPFAFTSCPVDPEATVSSTLQQGAAATGGFNYATYSAPRQFLATVKLSF